MSIFATPSCCERDRWGMVRWRSPDNDNGPEQTGWCIAHGPDMHYRWTPVAHCPFCGDKLAPPIAPADPQE